MSKSGWIIAVALVLSLASAEVWSQVAPNNEPSQEESATDANDAGQEQSGQFISLTTALQNIEAAIRDLITEEDKVEAERQQENERRDLAAQEQMAVWSFWMTLATIGGVIATFVGLALIAITLHHTKRAADYTKEMLREAERSAAAAEGAVAATRDVGEKQVRAYLHIKDIRVILGRKPGQIGIGITVANAGQSPAIAVGATIRIEARSRDFVALEVPLPNIAANSEVTRKTKPVKNEGFQGNFAGAERITVTAVIGAKDVFNQEIMTTAMRSVSIEGGALPETEYQLDDLDGIFPDAAVKLLNSGIGRGNNEA